MAAPRNETFVRLTDIVTDRVLRRLGTSGTDDAYDLAGRLEQALGMPVEVAPSDPASTLVQVGSVSYTLPDGRRLGRYRQEIGQVLAAGTLNFANGAISTGAVASFAAELPNMTVGNYVRALVQYDEDELALYVTFGTQNAVLASTGLPELLPNHVALAILELHSTAGGIGSFDVIEATAIILIPSLERGSAHETQTVSNPVGVTVFTLTSFQIPKNRNRLLVLVNGVLQVDEYTVTDDVTLTFSEAVPQNADVDFVLL